MEKLKFAGLAILSVGIVTGVYVSVHNRSADQTVQLDVLTAPEGDSVLVEQLNTDIEAVQHANMLKDLHQGAEFITPEHKALEQRLVTFKTEAEALEKNTDVLEKSENVAFTLVHSGVIKPSNATEQSSQIIELQSRLNDLKNTSH